MAKLETPDGSASLSCDRCGYDLRAHECAAACPECGMPVAESRRLSAIPRRPPWRASDRRWRRRVLAGVWVLVLVPLLDVLTALGWTAAVRVPTVFDFHGTLCTLDDTLLGGSRIYQPVLFCAGVALLFSKERGRRPNRLDWTRRWGVICSYVTLLLAAAPVLFISALVMVGISDLFLSMPARYQPRVTQALIDVSTTYLRYGPQPKDAADVVQVAASAVVVLLACVPLFDALRSSGPKRLAAALLAPLALFALGQLAQVALHCVRPGSVSPMDLYRYDVFFCPGLLARGFASRPGERGLSWPAPVLVELAKWGTVAAIAVWLTAASVVPRRSAEPGVGHPAAAA